MTEKPYDKALPGRAPSVSLGGPEPDSHQDRVLEQPLGLELPMPRPQTISLCSTATASVPSVALR